MKNDVNREGKGDVVHKDDAEIADKCAREFPSIAEVYASTTSTLHTPNVTCSKSAENDSNVNTKSEKLNAKVNFAKAVKRTFIYISELELIPTGIEEGRKVVVFDEEIYNLSRTWGKFGFKEAIVRNGMYFNKFNSEEGMKMVIERGPWMIRNKPLLVQKWNPNVCVEKKDPEVIPLWIKLYNVPLEAWSNKRISALASSLGKPIIMDQTTTKMCNESVGSIGTEEEKRQVDSRNVNQNVRKDNGALGDLCYHTLDIIRVARMLFMMALSLGIREIDGLMWLVGYGIAKLVVDMHALLHGTKHASNMDIKGYLLRINVPWDDVYGRLMDAVRRSANKYVIFASVEEVEIEDIQFERGLENMNELEEVLMRNWNVSLNVEDHLAGGSCKTADMIDFKECIKSIKVGDLHCFGLSTLQMESLKSWIKSLGIAALWLVKKLKALKFQMKNLSWKNGNLYERTIKWKRELQRFQTSVDGDPYNMQLKEEVAKIMKEYSSALQDEENFLSQQAKIKWLKDGDRNTKFFHAILKERKHKNKVATIYACDMIRSVSNEEIKEEMFNIEDNKAPGPDGYTSKFFKKAWTMVGDDVCMVIKEFFATGKLFGKVNATVISLVPKLDTPFKVSDFRPIACCNVVYKCISKILTNRIKKYLCKVFSQNQSAFIHGRKISNNILITQELLRGYNWKNGARRVSFKIDILKAYDNVNWSFLRQTLMLFGFPKDMIGWIMTCVSTATFSININRDRHGYFKGGRGLRKGDPISPYLFTLISHLCFADDLLMFCHGDTESVKVIKSALDEFSKVSNLIPNMGKSTIFFDKMADEDVPALAPTRSDDQILPFAAWVPIGKSNYLDEEWFTLDANLLREALEITPIYQAHPFVSPPSGDAIMDFMNKLGYPEARALSHDRPIIRTSSDAYSPTKKGRKDKHHVIPYCRFTKLIIFYLGRTHNIHQRSSYPFHLVEEDLRRVAKHDQKVAAKKEGMKKLASAKLPKPKLAIEKSSKPAPTPKPKVTKEKPSKASTANPPKPKPVKEKSTKATPLQKASNVKVAKSYREGKNLYIGTCYSEDLESFQCNRFIHARVGGVANSRTSLQQAPKRKSTTDRFQLLHRLTAATKSASTGSAFHKINEVVCENVKEAVQISLQAPLRDRFRDLSKEDMKEMLHQRMLETGSYKSLPDHIALYEALKVSMELAQRDEFFAEKDKSPPQSSAWKKSDTRDAPSSSSKQQSGPHADNRSKITIQDLQSIFYFRRVNADFMNCVCQKIGKTDAYSKQIWKVKLMKSLNLSTWTRSSSVSDGRVSQDAYRSD
ncbi:RNA-directed DNA polymerase, eukaryota, reverse transcriptase zinc-binding domain protein [Tanacetum coccineum]